MRHLLLIILTSWWVAAANGQSPDPKNAATWYQRAIDQYNKLPQSQRDLLVDYDPATPPSAEVRAALANVQGILQFLERGSRQEYCDFQLDRSQGIALMLPHLSTLRFVARVARVDAAVKIHDGDGGGAADRIAAIYRLAAHPGDDHIAISSLVGQAILQLADGTAQLGLDRAAFSDQDSAALLAAVSELNANDPVNYLEAMVGEQEIAMVSLEQFRESPEELAEAFGESASPEILAMNEAAFDDAMLKYDNMMNEVVKVFAMEDTEAAKAEIGQWQKNLVAGVYGPLAMSIVPAFTRLYERKLDAQKLVAQRVELFTKLSNGEVKPVEAANAALWYQRGIEQLEKLEPKLLQAVRDFDAGVKPPLGEEVEASLAGKQVQDAIDIFREGSLIRRCDFAAISDQAASWHLPVLAPDYVPDMHDAMRLIRTDAARLLAVPDADGATDRLCVAYRMIGHVGGDQKIVSALVSQLNCDRTTTLADASLRSGMLGEQHKSALFEASERIGRADPFGYLSAVEETGKALAKRFDYRVTTGEDERARLNTEAQSIRAFNGDQILYVLAIQQAMMQSPQPFQGEGDKVVQPREKSEAALKRLADVILLAGIEAAQGDVLLVAPRIAQDDWDIFDDSPLPAIAPGGVNSHIQRARSDLRKVTLLLSPRVQKNQEETPEEANPAER